MLVDILSSQVWLLRVYLANLQFFVQRILKMIDSCDDRGPNFMHREFRDCYEGIRLQNAFHEVQVVELL